MGIFFIRKERARNIEERNSGRKRFTQILPTAQCQTWDGDFQAPVSNISSSGAFIKTSQRFFIEFQRRVYQNQSTLFHRPGNSDENYLSRYHGNSSGNRRNCQNHSLGRGRQIQGFFQVKVVPPQRFKNSPLRLRGCGAASKVHMNP
jgi:hypothetical protein